MKNYLKVLSITLLLSLSFKSEAGKTKLDPNETTFLEDALVNPNTVFRDYFFNFALSNVKNDINNNDYLEELEQSETNNEDAIERINQQIRMMCKGILAKEKAIAEGKILDPSEIEYMNSWNKMIASMITEVYQLEQPAKDAYREYLNKILSLLMLAVNDNQEIEALHLINNLSDKSINFLIGYLPEAIDNEKDSMTKADMEKIQNIVLANGDARDEANRLEQEQQRPPVVRRLFE